MMNPQLAHIFKILKIWLSRLARRSSRLFFSFLSSLRHFTAGLFTRKLNDRQALFHTGALQGDLAGNDLLISSSFLPPGQGSQEVVGALYPSDDPYLSARSRPSVLSLHVSQETGESSTNVHDNTTFLRDPLQQSSSPSLRRTPSMNSGSSTNTRCSIPRSIAGSEIRRSEYRKHTGPVHYLPGSTHGSVVDLYHASSRTVSVRSDLPGPIQAVPTSNTDIDHHAHFTAPPLSSNGLEHPPTEVVVVYDLPQIGELVPDKVRRYKSKIRPANASKTTIPALTITFPAIDMPVPPGWISVVHPEGSRYFVNQAKRTFTEVNICDPVICQDIECLMEYWLEKLEEVVQRDQRDQLDMTQVDLVIEPKVLDDDSLVVCYYFANHRTRCIFWLSEFDAKDIICDCKGVESLSHIRLAIQAQYWKHWDYFPNLCPVAQSLIDDVKDMLVHATFDHLSSKQSSAAYDVNELRDYMSVVNQIQVYPPANQSMERCHAAIIIGRIKHAFSQNAFLNFHGESCARLTFEQTIHGWEYIPSMSMIFLAPLLFLEPVAQVQELHRIFADKIARTSRWNAFSSNLKGQLHNSNLLATVLLNANVGFLAINTVDKGGRSAIQMASYMSLVTSLGSIVLGLLFVSHDRTSGESTAEEAASFLSMLYDKRHGLEKLAIIYSLPKAFLIWGMVFFFAAFSIDWWTSGDRISRAVVGAVILVVFLMIANSIVCTREGDLRWPTNPLHSLGLSSRLANVWSRGVEFIKRAQRNGGHESEFGLTPTGLSQANTEAMYSVSRSTFSSSSISVTLNAANSPRQLNDGGPTFLSPHSHTNLNFTSGGGSSQQARGDISQYQLTTEAHSEPDHASLRVHLTTSSLVDEQLNSGGISTDATILSEYEEQTPVVPTDTDAVSPDPLRPDSMEGANYTENVVNEPQELETPQRRESITPPPMIFARGATGDDFYHASYGCQVDATIQS